MENEQQNTETSENNPSEHIHSEQVVEQSPEASEEPSTPEQTAKKRFRHKKLILLLVITALVVGASSAGATYYFVSNNTEKNNSETTNSDNLQAGTKLEAKAVEEKTTTIANTYTWLDVPKQVDKLPLFKNPESTNEADGEGQVITSMEYYLIGNGPDGSEVYIVAGQEEMGGRPYMTVVKKDDAYSILKLHSGSYFYTTGEGQTSTYHGPTLLPGVTVDPTSSIADIKAPEEVNFKGQKFSTKYPGSTEAPYLMFMEKLPVATEYSTYQEAGKITEGTVYEDISKDDPTYRVSHYELRIKPPFYLTMYLKGELSDQEIDPITWNDGAANTVNYASAGRGCGAANGNEIAKYGKDQLVQIGKSGKGQVIYGFKDNTNPLLLKHHAEYIDDSKYIDEWTSTDETYYKKANFGLPIDQYVALRPLYIVEDGMGRMLVFSRQDLVLTGGCAKPVVYVYPTLPTLVDVSVGADVTISDPLYENGWKNVLALPNGLLGYNGKQYDSLFWEGFGHGEYPQITSGAVVRRNEAERTMRNHLKQLGLNEKESTDFMDFWTSKIPDTPYVRLSWLGTSDMERLAPLYVSPAPDTRIRIFLDMEGLDTGIAIPAQKLHAVPRIGFTVVEWGGLVTDGSVPLLR